MKNINTIIKNVEAMTEDTLYSVIEDTHVNFDELTRREKQSFLTLCEVKKAVENSKYSLVFDCDFETSKFHDEKKQKDGSAQYLIDYACIVSKTDVNTRLLQIYTTSTNTETYFRICTTCKEALRNAKVFESFGFKTRFDTKTGRAKTTQRTNIAYTDIVSCIKNVLSILEEDKKGK